MLQDGVVYAPLEKIAEPLGITYNLTDESGNYLTLKKGDATLVFPRYNESTVLLNGHEMAASYYLCDYDYLYVPLRFVAETFGGKVQYVDDYEKTYCHEDDSESPNWVKVSVIAIEMPNGTKPQYVSKDGLEKITDVSVQYQKDLIAAKEETNQEIEQKFYYDASAVTYTGGGLSSDLYHHQRQRGLYLLHVPWRLCGGGGFGRRSFGCQRHERTCQRWAERQFRIAGAGVP